MFGQDAPWDATQHLLAELIDLLAGANWQRGGDSKSRRPKPYPRPDPARGHQRQQHLRHAPGIGQRVQAARERRHRELALLNEGSDPP